MCLFDKIVYYDNVSVYFLLSSKIVIKEYSVAEGI